MFLNETNKRIKKKNIPISTFRPFRFQKEVPKCFKTQGEISTKKKK